MCCLETVTLCIAMQVDHDTYHRMVEDYRAAKQKEGKDELKIKQCVAFAVAATNYCMPLATQLLCDITLHASKAAYACTEEQAAEVQRLGASDG
jgi:hypothetical protein